MTRLPPDRLPQEVARRILAALPPDPKAEEHLVDLASEVLTAKEFRAWCNASGNYSRNRGGMSRRQMNGRREHVAPGLWGGTLLDMKFEDVQLKGDVL